MKGFILVNGYKLLNPIKYCVNRLKEEFLKDDIELDVKQSTDILAFIMDGKIQTLVKKYEFCVFLDKDYYISYMLEKSGLRLFNCAKSIELCDDKMKTYISLTDNNINMPKTISGPLNYAGIKNDNFIKNLVKQLDFPIVAKENFGSQGSKVYLVNNLEELTELENKIAPNARLYQSLVKDSWGEDYRLIVIGHKYVAGMRRYSKNGDFRSNINLGGDGEAIEMDPSYIALAEKVSHILNLDYCGVDILKSSQGPVLCEVNSNAFFKKIEEITHINVAKAYKEHILSVLNISKLN